MIPSLEEHERKLKGVRKASISACYAALTQYQSLANT
jgi:hypothetical protein